MTEHALAQAQLVERPARGMGAGKLHRVRVAAALAQGLIVNKHEIDHPV